MWGILEEKKQTFSLNIYFFITLSVIKKSYAILSTTLYNKQKNPCSYLSIQVQ